MMFSIINAVVLRPVSRWVGFDVRRRRLVYPNSSGIEVVRPAFLAVSPHSWSRIKTMRYCVISTVFVGLITLVPGCGGPQGTAANIPTARLEGAVTLDGKPLDGGSVQFVPQGQPDAPITDATILGGRYVAPKVPIGKHLAIVKMTPPDPPAVVSSDYRPPETAAIPDRYKAGVPIEVKEDKADLDIAMSSK